jgi:hypothetical protein
MLYWIERKKNIIRNTVYLQYRLFGALHKLHIYLETWNRFDGSHQNYLYQKQYVIY